MRTAVLSMSLCLWIVCLAVSTYIRNAVYENPVALLRNVVACSPGKWRTRVNFAHELIMMGMRTGESQFYREALAELNNAAASIPVHGDAMGAYYGELGLAYYHLGRVETAIAQWQEGLKQSPADAETEGNIAYALLDQGKFEEAYEYAFRANQHDPALPIPVHLLGLIFLETGRYRLAAEQFLHYQKLRPEEAGGYWNAALAFEKAGKYQQARAMALAYLSREHDPRQRKSAQSFLIEMEMVIRRSNQKQGFAQENDLSSGSER
jgi:tetratricopeptide (TPR) repeat protein